MSTNNSNGPIGTTCVDPNDGYVLAWSPSAGQWAPTQAVGANGPAPLSNAGYGFIPSGMWIIPQPQDGYGQVMITWGGGGCGGTVKKKDKDGCDCKKCKEIFPYAEPNQDDGTLICYSCRLVW